MVRLADLMQGYLLGLERNTLWGWENPVLFRCTNFVLPLGLSGRNTLSRQLAMQKKHSWV